MALKDFILKQFVDVIDWTESEAGVLAFRYPMSDREIQNGAQLTVRESQLALFVNEGKAADVLGAGMHRLTTQTLPILTYLSNWDKAFQSPFKSDVYFFSLREQIDRKWGTANPITFRDKDYGAVRLRAFGSYSFKIADAAKFWAKLPGTVELYRVEDVEGQLRAMIITQIASVLGASNIAFVDMAANQGEFSNHLLAALKPAFLEYGLELATFYVQSLSLPEELQQHFDRAASMRIVGNLQNYTQFQAAESIQTAAANPGGVASAGVGLGAGVAMGQQMAAAMAGVSGAATATTPNKAPSAEETLATIERLHGLIAKGILTQAEFDTKKVELLAMIR
jgi:membrane protease subunit (stomatin/prohibitin family)